MDIRAYESMSSLALSLSRSMLESDGDEAWAPGKDGVPKTRSGVGQHTKRKQKKIKPNKKKQEKVIDRLESKIVDLTQDLIAAEAQIALLETQLKNMKKRKRMTEVQKLAGFNSRGKLEAKEGSKVVKRSCKNRKL